MRMEAPEVLAAAVALALNGADVPCVLWGQYLLNLHGIEMPINVRS